MISTLVKLKSQSQGVSVLLRLYLLYCQYPSVAVSQNIRILAIMKSPNYKKLFSQVMHLPTPGVPAGCYESSHKACRRQLTKEWLQVIKMSIVVNPGLGFTLILLSTILG